MPFNTQQFLDVFARYNETVFPWQIILFAAALVMIRLAAKGDTASSKKVAAMLGFLWLWMGVIYDWLFFSEINNLAFVFGGFFVLQSVILFYAGVVRGDLLFCRQSGARSLIGTLFIVYALLIYPIIGMSAGHSYPYSPTFGLPCPTTIFTFGLLLRSGRSVPIYVLPIPVIWSLVGFSATYWLGMWEDIGLLIAGMIAGALLIGFHPGQSYEISRKFGFKEN
jgi:hypothetical protein